jgi:Bacterial membrane protein YfhO
MVSAVWLRRTGVQTAIAAAVFALLTLGYFNPIFRHGLTFSLTAGHASVQYPWAATPTNYHDAVQSDQANNDYPIQVDLSRNLRAGQFPFWSTYSFTGAPTLGTVYGVGFYPPRVVASLVVSPSWVHDLLEIFHVWLAGFAMFLLCRRLGLSLLAGALGGIAWMFGPSWWAITLLEGSAVFAGLLPLALWFMHRAVTGRSLRDAAGTGAVLALLVLGASVQPAVFCFLIVCGWGLVIGLEPRARAGRAWHAIVLQNAKFVAVAGALGVALCAFLLIPESAQIADSGRTQVPASIMAAQRMTVAQFAHFLNWTPKGLDGNTVWAVTFLGVPAGLLAIVGLFSRRGGTGLGRTVAILFFLAVVGTPVTDFGRAFVPGFAYIVPLGRLLPFFTFGAVLLAAAGLDTLGGLVDRFVPASRRRAGQVAFTTVVVAALALQTWQLVHYDRGINPPFEPRDNAHQFPRTPLIAALEANNTAVARTGSVQRIIPIVHNGPYDPFTPPPLVGEIARKFRIENVGGYLNVLPQRTRAVVLALEGVPVKLAGTPAYRAGAFETFFFATKTRFDLLKRLGVDTIVSGPAALNDKRLNAQARVLRARRIYSGADGQLLALPGAAPRAFVVDGVQTTRSGQGALQRFVAPSFDVRRAVLFDGADAAGTRSRTSPGPVRARTRILPTGPNDRTIEVDSRRAGWLVLLESWAKGWTATVNGTSTPIKRGDYAFRAVRVPAGRSIVKMHYTPPGLWAGVAVSALGFLAVIGICCWPLVAGRRRTTTSDLPATSAPSPQPS